MDAHLADERRTKTGITVSDLHLFSDYTVTEQMMPRIHAAAERADIFVLNGDIFEFNFPSKGLTQDAVLERAMNWLRELALAHPRTQIHFVLGNHDGVHCPERPERDFPTRLKQLEQELKDSDAGNFHFHPETFMPAANALFTHGDLPLRGQNLEKRPYVDIDEAKVPEISAVEALGSIFKGTWGSSVGNYVEQVVYANAVLHKASQIGAALHNRRTRIHPILAKHLTYHHKVKDLHDIFHIFTGHTHVPITNEMETVTLADCEGKEYRQTFAFHNTGSSVREEEFNMLEFDIVPQRAAGKELNKQDSRYVWQVEHVRAAEELRGLKRPGKLERLLYQRVTDVATGVRGR